MEVQDLEKLVNQRSQSISSAMPALMRKVYTWMTLALAITGICAYGTATSPAILSMVYGNRVMPIVLIIATFGPYPQAEPQHGHDPLRHLFGLDGRNALKHLPRLFADGHHQDLLYYCRHIRSHGRLWQCDEDRLKQMGQHPLHGSYRTDHRFVG